MSKHAVVAADADLFDPDGLIYDEQRRGWLCPKCDHFERTTKDLYFCPKCESNDRSAAPLKQGLVAEPVRMIYPIPRSVDSVKEKNMSATPQNHALVPTVAELPDEDLLSREVPERPNWPELVAEIEGIDGKDLIHAGECGAAQLQLISDRDTAIKNYLPRFSEWWWGSVFGRVIKAARELDATRLAEEKRCKDLRALYSRIQGDALLERNRIVEAERRRLEDLQRQQAEEERRKEVEALRAQQTEEAEQAAKELQQAPLIPVAVSKQVVAASGVVPQAPANISGKRYFEREITDMSAFVKWLAANPNYIPMVKPVFNFTGLKTSNVAIPGVKVTERMGTANRGR